MGRGNPPIQSMSNANMKMRSQRVRTPIAIRTPDPLPLPTPSAIALAGAGTARHPAFLDLLLPTPSAGPGRGPIWQARPSFYWAAPVDNRWVPALTRGRIPYSCHIPVLNGPQGTLTVPVGSERPSPIPTRDPDGWSAHSSGCPSMGLGFSGTACRRLPGPRPRSAPVPTPEWRGVKGRSPRAIPIPQARGAAF